MAATGAQTPRTAYFRARATATLRRVGIGRFELAVAALLTLLAFAMLLDSAQLALRSGDATLWGADSPVVGDTAQYLALVRDAADHVLVGNPFDMRSDDGTLLHPGWVASGALAAAGLPVPLAFLAFKPLALLLVFLGAHLYTRRLFAGRLQRRVALTLALFGLSPVLAVVVIGEVAPSGNIPFAGSVERQFISISRELSPLAQLWGYPWAAITVGLMPLVLLAYERGRRGQRRMLAAAAIGLALCSWLHPWQGATLLLVITAVELTEVVRRARRDRGAASERGKLLLRTALPVLGVGALPLAYFYALNHFDDDSRRLGALLDGGFWRPQVLAAAFLPLVLPALLAYRIPARSFQEAAARWWLPVALFVYVQPAGTFRNHAVEGLALPIAVLIVIGVAGLPRVRRLRPEGRRAAAIAGVALMCVPAVAAHLLILHLSATDPVRRPYMTSGEADALRALERNPRAGGVLAPLPVALLVPGLTGREIWSSGLAWTPNHFERAQQTARLFEGELRAGEARRLVRATGARYLVSGCSEPAVDLRPALGDLVVRAERHDCARVYELRD